MEPVKHLPPDIATIETWEEVDVALGVLRLTEARLDAIAVEVDTEIQRLQEAKRRRSVRLVGRRERVEALVRTFVEGHRDGFAGGKRSLRFTHGEVGFRWGKPRVEIENEDRTKALLRVRGLDACIVTQESLDRAALRKLPGPELNLCGIVVLQDESFFYKLSKDDPIPYPADETADTDTDAEGGVE